MCCSWAEALLQSQRDCFYSLHSPSPLAQVVSADEAAGAYSRQHLIVAPCCMQTWTWSVTRGVHVRLSTVFVPENTRGKAIAPNGTEIPPRFCFAYRYVAA